jgi:hypothetical protein
MTRRILLVASLFAFASAALAAPNFSGNWKINAAKSKSDGQFPLPERFERKITHMEPALEVTTTRTGFQGGDDVTTTTKYSTDGKETTNSGTWTVAWLDTNGAARDTSSSTPSA